MSPSHERFFAALTRFGPLPSEAVGAIEPLLQPFSFAQGGWLLRAGDQARWCHLITSGLVREFYIDADGGEHTRTFVPENGITGSLVDLISGQPAITLIEALEPVETIAFPYPEFRALSNTIPALERLARLTAEELYVRKVHREHELLALPARDRYQRWLTRAPDLDRRVRRRDLASYLGITPEHLSRLRAERRA